MIYRILLAAGFLVPSLCVAAAEGMLIEPGKWRITSETTVSDIGRPITTGAAFCFADGILRPENLHSEELRAGCKYTDKDIDDTYMTWKVECPTDAGGSNGSWMASSFTKRFKSSGSLAVSYGEETSSMTIDMVGIHLGDCDRSTTGTDQQ